MSEQSQFNESDLIDFLGIFDSAMRNPVLQEKAKTMTQDITIQPYVLKIKELESDVKFLARMCAKLSTKPHEQNSDYWLELTSKK